jgi:hypothetical protein
VASDGSIGVCVWENGFFSLYELISLDARSFWGEENDCDIMISSFPEKKYSSELSLVDSSINRF